MGEFRVALSGLWRDPGEIDPGWGGKGSI